MWREARRDVSHPAWPPSWRTSVQRDCLQCLATQAWHGLFPGVGAGLPSLQVPIPGALGVGSCPRGGPVTSLTNPQRSLLLLMASASLCVPTGLAIYRPPCLFF